MQYILEPYTKPIYVPGHRLPHSRRMISDNLVQGMLKNKIHEPNKKSIECTIINCTQDYVGSLCPVVDHCLLNVGTVPDRTPLPVLTDPLQSIGKNR